MNTRPGSISRWIPTLLLGVTWLALWLTGIWLKPPRPDVAIAVIKVNDVYLDGKRFTCESLSPTMAFDLGCQLDSQTGVLRVETRANTTPNCTASLAGEPLPCQLRGFGYFHAVAEVTAPPEVAATFAPGDVTLVALGVHEQSWLWIGLGILALTSLLAVGAAWAWARHLPKWRILSAGLALVWLLPLNLFIVVANFAGLSMID